MRCALCAACCLFFGVGCSLFIVCCLLFVGRCSLCVARRALRAV